MSSGESNLNPSSLIDLKAELHKKYESFRRAKLIPKSESSNHTPFRSKVDPPKDKKIKVPSSVKQDDEDNIALQKSRLALEEKAKLYEKIVAKDILLDEEQNERYLVDFERKVLYDPSKRERVDEDNHECVPEQTNTLGKGFPDRKQIPQNDSGKVSDTGGDESLHYQDIQYNEVRDHGTGYFAFSTNETQRKEQMEDLHSMRQETEEQRILKQRLERKRKITLQARLEKICQRKNINQSVLENYTTIEAEKDVTEAPLVETNVEDAIPKEIKVRPWDVGKEGLQAFVPEKVKKLKSQREWIEDRRDERTEEFAPPSFYT